MNLNAARALAERLIAKHLHPSWRFKWHGGLASAGLCSKNRIISLSRPVTAESHPDDVRDTVLHEIAHALAGWRSAEHGPKWKGIARRLGARVGLESTEREDDATDKAERKRATSARARQRLEPRRATPRASQ